MFWSKKTPKNTVKRFIDALNKRDFARVEELLADDFRLIDNTGRSLQGRDQCLELLVRLAELIPDYELTATSIVQRGEDILISGSSQTTDRLMGSASQWRARASKEKMLEWQSYARGSGASLIAQVAKSLQ
ncbi:nuclear transport factor 2 family protein [Aurantiacibacter rhizosphaerae]|uniref:DUF4440 domain-containing protein n=1 Tax=Aurantiacibacter rhizosphaerae TaxID=2691582 RepID=A0A844XDG1_9SPHN|nr:nuclear transport factor 2 family protein [Aurantiacibacter rhizosphaerae]MWV27654.1 DUF4440 domain-containing protein [Aurantiacibacter rhizosphaerae]